LLLYAPVVHEGVIRCIERHATDELQVFLIGESVLAGSEYLPRSQREFPLPMPDLLAAVDAVLKQRGVHVTLTEATAETLALVPTTACCVQSRHEIVSWVVAQHWAGREVADDTVFIRWDIPFAGMYQLPEAVLPKQEHTPEHREIMATIRKSAAYSDNTFRQVGAALVLPDGKIYTGYNHGGEYIGEGWTIGNPRALLDKGGHPEINPDIHAEQAVLMQALREGLQVKGAALWVTTFPCRTCANMIAQSGIATVVFEEGYSVLGSEEVLQRAGVTVLQWDEPTQ
jgi:dCMP deaminase